MKQTQLPADVTLEEIKQLIKEDRYKDQIQKLSTEKLQFLVEEANEGKLLGYAREGIKKTEPEKFTESYIKTVGEGMKILARIVLKERKKG